MFVYLNYFNLHFKHTLAMSEIIECNYKNENNLKYLQKSAKHLVTNIEIYMHKNLFLNKWNIIEVLSIQTQSYH